MKWLCLLSVCLWMLAGCESTPQEPPLPRIDELRSPIRHSPPPRDPSIPQSQALLRVRKIWMPLDRSTDAVWALVNESAFSKTTRSRWNANGLRVGLIPRKNLEAMGKELPQPYRLENRRVQSSDHPTAIHRSQLLRGVVTVNLTRPPKAVREEKITGGHPQLMLQAHRDHFISLTPHHHVPKASLWPRNAWDKQLDGRLFTELGLSTNIASQQVLVVGLHRPFPPQWTPPPEASTGEPVLKTEGAESPEAEISGGEGELPLLDNHLGRALFTREQAGRSTQLLLLIEVELWYNR